MSIMLNGSTLDFQKGDNNGHQIDYIEELKQQNVKYKVGLNRTLSGIAQQKER